MNMRAIRYTVFLLPFACSILTACVAGESLKLPAKIVLTERDAKDINTLQKVGESGDLKGTLRGRPVDLRLLGRAGTLDGLQPFTGRKADVVNWFRSGREGLTGGGGSKLGVPPVHFQYALLCSALLQTGDVDIIRAILWSKDNSTYCTGYLAPDWKKLIEDRRLTTPERILAWRRSYGNSWGGRECTKAFWRLFGDDLKSEHLLEIQASGQRLPWEVLFKLPGQRTPGKKAREVLLPLLRREYLSVGKGELIRGALRCLNSLHESSDMKYPNMLLDKLSEWDQLGDDRSVLMWDGLRAFSKWDDKTCTRVRTFIAKARVPQNAAKAFWAFSYSTSGRKIIRGDKRGWQVLYEEYLRIAFEKSDTDRDVRRQKQVEFLQALTGEYRAKDGKVSFRKNLSFLQFLQESKVVLTVTDEQRKVLAGAWSHFPEAMKHVTTEAKRDKG